MAEVQSELTPEEEARIKWEQLLQGKSVAADDSVPAEDLVETMPSEPVLDVVDNSPEAVLAKLYKSMIKD